MESIKTKGIIRFEIKGVNGEVRDSWIVENLTTTVGKAQAALLYGDASATPFTYIALGTSSTAPATGNTALGAEITTNGLQRASATVSQVTTTTTNDTLRLVKAFTASGSHTVEEIGYFNASSSGTMGGRALTGTKTLVSGEVITATYDIIFS